MSDFEPKIVAFLCWKWGYGACDMAGTIRAQYPASIRPVRILCTGRVSSDLIMRAFGKGADGVMVGGWHVNECDFANGNIYARNLVSYLQDVLETMGLERERLQMIFISAAEGERFKNLSVQMDAQIRKLGPNPIRVIQRDLKQKALAKAAARKKKAVKK
jgi:F420-non-reducing hydrogenase iron-sulfur subunit